MSKTKIIAIFLFAALFLAACSASESNIASNSAGSAPATGEPELSTMERADEGGGGGTEKVGDNIAQNQISLEQDAQTPTEPEKPIERRIIRNAEIQLESETPEEAQQKITAIAEGKGGYIVTTQKSSNPRTGIGEIVNMTLRVSSEKFNETLDEIRKTGSRVVSENITGEDITDQFVDMQARLRSEKALEQQILEILKRANTVQEALNVQRQLADVRGKIEQMEGKLRQWDKLASLSTIKVTLQTPTAISGSSEGFFYRLKDSISTGLDGALSFILGFITVLIAILPFLILIVLPIYLILRYFWGKQVKIVKIHDTKKIVEEEIREE